MVNPNEIFTSQIERYEDKSQRIIIGVIVAVVLVGGYFAFKTPSPEEKVVAPVNDSSAVIAPVIDGDLTYSLDGLRWIFEPQDQESEVSASTRVRLQLEGFKRNGSPIAVGLYRLGTYRGACKSFAVHENEQALPDAGALAFAECTHEGVTRQLAAFQENTTLVVKARVVRDEDEQLEPLVPILTIDLTKIVQSGVY